MSNKQLTDEFYPEQVLDSPPNSDAVKKYSEELLKIEECFIEIEREATEIPIGWTGIRASHKFSSLEMRHRQYVDRLSRARIAVLRETLDPTHIGEFESTQEFQKRAGDNEFDTYLERLNQLATRTGQRLASRRTAANTRVGLIISLSAVVISLLSIAATIILQAGI